MPYPVIAVELPGWIEDYVARQGSTFATRDERMAFTIGLASENVKQGTGGPFGAAVFETETGNLVAPGVNLVVPSSVAVAHAEIIAIALAGRVRGTFDLGADGPTELYASTEPCAMCFGSIPWSGVSTLVCAARDGDARSVGFDEGPKLDDWQAALESRGIAVICDVRREEAKSVLEDYAMSGGLIYNAGAGG